MIALLCSSMTLLENENDSVISSTGVVEYEIQDSVLIAFSDLRIANSKMVELKYEKEINKHYRTIINNDSIAIDNLNIRYNNLVEDNRRNLKSVKRQRNYLGLTTITSVVLLILSIL